MGKEEEIETRESEGEKKRGRERETVTGREGENDRVEDIGRINYYIVIL